MAGQSMTDRMLGDIKLSRIHESYLHEPVRAWFPDFNDELFREHEAWLAPKYYDPATARIIMPVHSWVLRSNKYTILVDGCVGNDKDRPRLEHLHHLNTNYLDKLKAAGVQPEDVDYVLCTHLHVDHVGWFTRLDHGRWVPTFPNAKYVWSRIDHDYTVTHANTDSVPPFFTNMYNDSVLPIVEAGQALVVDGDYQFSDDILIRPAPGHSAGHVRIEVRSRGALGVFCGDVFHSPLQVPLWEWSSRTCFDRAQSTRTRYDLLSFCAEHNALLIPTHFDDPYVGRIVRKKDTFGINFGWD